MRNPYVRIGIVLVTTVIGVGLGFGFSALQETRYQAETALRFDPSARPDFQALGSGAQSPDPGRAAESDRAAVGSYDVAIAAARRLPALRLSPETLQNRVAVASDRASDVITITASAATRAEATRIVQAWSDAYRDTRRTDERSRAANAQKALQSQLAELTPRARRGDEGDSLRQQIGSLAVLRRIGSGTPVVIEKAHAGVDRAQPKTGRNMVFGGLLGLLAGIGLVALAGRAGSADSPTRPDPPPPARHMRTNKEEVMGSR